MPPVKLFTISLAGGRNLQFCIHVNKLQNNLLIQCVHVILYEIVFSYNYLVQQIVFKLYNLQ